MFRSFLAQDLIFTEFVMLAKKWIFVNESVLLGQNPPFYEVLDQCVRILTSFGRKKRKNARDTFFDEYWISSFDIRKILGVMIELI